MRSLLMYCAALTLIGGCQSQPADPTTAPKPSYVTISWTGYDGERNVDPDAAVFFVNGKEVGRGRDGFAAVVRFVASLPEHSRVFIYPDPEVRKLRDAEGQGEPYHGFAPRRALPYAAFKDLTIEFRRTVNVREMHASFLAGAPGTYTYTIDVPGGGLRREDNKLPFNYTEMVPNSEPFTPEPSMEDIVRELKRQEQERKSSGK